MVDLVLAEESAAAKTARTEAVVKSARAAIEKAMMKLGPEGPPPKPLSDAPVTAHDQN